VKWAVVQQWEWEWQLAKIRTSHPPTHSHTYNSSNSFPPACHFHNTRTCIDACTTRRMCNLSSKRPPIHSAAHFHPPPTTPPTCNAERQKTSKTKSENNTKQGEKKMMSVEKTSKTNETKRKKLQTHKSSFPNEFEFEFVCPLRSSAHLLPLHFSALFLYIFSVLVQLCCFILRNFCVIFSATHDRAEHKYYKDAHTAYCILLTACSMLRRGLLRLLVAHMCL